MTLYLPYLVDFPYLLDGERKGLVSLLVQKEVPPMSQRKGLVSLLVQKEVPPMSQRKGLVSQLVQKEVPPMSQRKGLVSQLVQKEVPPMSQRKGLVSLLVQKEVPPMSQICGQCIGYFCQHMFSNNKASVPCCGELLRWEKVNSWRKWQCSKKLAFLWKDTSVKEMTWIGSELTILRLPLSILPSLVVWRS